jgi:hypothetical protein
VLVSVWSVQQCPAPILSAKNLGSLHDVLAIVINEIPYGESDSFYMSSDGIAPRGRIACEK